MVECLAIIECFPSTCTEPVVSVVSTGIPDTSKEGRVRLFRGTRDVEYLGEWLDEVKEKFDAFFKRTGFDVRLVCLLENYDIELRFEFANSKDKSRVIAQIVKAGVGEIEDLLEN